MPRSKHKAKQAPAPPPDVNGKNNVVILRSNLLKLSGDVMCGHCRLRIQVQNFGEVTCPWCGKRQNLALLIQPIANEQDVLVPV